MRRSTRRVVVVLILAVLGFGVLPAQAVIPDPFEPFKIAVLIQIADRLQTVYKTLAAVNDKVKSTRNRLEMMFPNETMAPILTVFGQVQSIKDEITKLSCAWRFSPRTEGMRLGMLKLGPLCRDQIHRMFGAPLPGLDQDLQEMRQWQGAIRYNMVKESIAIGPSWTAAAQQLGRDARAGGASNDHARSYDADLQEYMNWTSTVSHNMVQERTTGMEPGVRGEASQGPEYSWMRIANESSQALADRIKTPGEAIRWAGVLSTDNLQVANSTHQLRAQAASVEQQTRDYRVRKRRLDQAFDLYLLELGTAPARPRGGR